MFRWLYRLPLLLVVALMGFTTQAIAMPSLVTVNLSTHFILLYVCIALSLIIFSVLLYALIKQRTSKKAHFHQHLGRELVWTTIPFIIVVVLAFPAVIELIQRSPS